MKTESSPPANGPRIIRGLAALFAVALFVGGCGGAQEPQDVSATSEESTRAAPADEGIDEADIVEYVGVGLVKSVTPNRKHVIVSHEEIPDFMDAMTMPFAVRDTAVLSGVQGGDSLRFTVQVQGPEMWLSRVESIP